MNSELERTWKEPLLSLSLHLPGGSEEKCENPQNIQFVAHYLTWDFLSKE
jgi:hypothetical protein